MDTPTLVPADTAWMLVSTALVLLMTPALAFFYGGLVRSKNALNTMMMSVAALGFVGVAWARPRLQPRLRRGLGLRGRALEGPPRRGGPRAAGHDPAPPLHGLPGHLRDHHRRPRVGRDRRADALRGLPRLHHAVEPRRLRPGRALGLGRRLPREDGRPRLRGRHRRPRQRGHRRPRGRGRDRPAQGLRPAGHPAAQRALHAPRRGAAVVRLVRLQRRQRARRERDRGPRLREHHARPRRDARGLDRARPPAQRQGHRGRRRHRHRGRPRGDHPGGRLHRPPARARPRRAGRLPELLRPRLPRAHAARRLARRGGRPRPGRHGGSAPDRRLRLEELERHRRRPPARQPRPAGHPGDRRGRRRSPTAGSRATCCSRSSAS